MKRSEERILVTHTGSLPRPRDLTELLFRKNQGEPYDAAAFERACQSAIVDVVAKQAETGIDIANDGEQSRTAFFLYVTHRMTGFGGSWDRPPVASTVKYPEYARMQQEASRRQRAVQARTGVPMAIGPIAYTGFAELEAECTDFHRALDRRPGAFADRFMTAASPGIISTALKNQYFDNQESYVRALGEALRHEYEAIVKAGFLLQIDSPDLAHDRGAIFGDRPLSEFLDFAELVIDTINAALRNIPPQSVRLHVCWGNNDGPHDEDVDLADILPTILKAKVGALVLPFATGRQAHEYKTFSRIRLPDEMLLVAGVIDTRTNVIEHPEAVADRLERVAAVIGDPRRVIAGTDCGFATAAGTSMVASDVVWAKLAALRDGARIASSRLF